VVLISPETLSDTTSSHARKLCHEYFLSINYEKFVDNGHPHFTQEQHFNLLNLKPLLPSQLPLPPLPQPPLQPIQVDQHNPHHPQNPDQDSKPSKTAKKLKDTILRA
jgi:hypothetical protein